VRGKAQSVTSILLKYSKLYDLGVLATWETVVHLRPANARKMTRPGGRLKPSHGIRWSGRLTGFADTEAEWQRLVRFLPGYVDLAQDKRRRRERFYLALYILIMGNTGIRIGEARKLRWRDVSNTRTLTDEVRSILSVRGKTGEREVVCNKGVESCSGAPVGSFKGGFQRALKEAGILFASDGKKRVPYSLRHTYATMRLAEGVSVFQLAANMGTSVEMLEDFYGKKRMRDPRMATEVTKLRRREDAV
jgi:integrase